MDPFGQTKFAGAFDAMGNVIAHYTYGLGLTSLVDAAGQSGYFDFNRQGSTVGLSGAMGTYANQYSYLPYGQLLSSAGSIANPFTFGGQMGLFTDASGLTSMTNRTYDAATGRFLTRDPLSVAGGDTDLYSFGNNDPVNEVDPQGTNPLILAGALIGAGISEGGYLVGSLISGEQVTWGGAAGAAVSGAITGGVIGATGGLGLLEGAAPGAGASAAGSVVQHAIDGDLGNSGGKIVEDTIVGAIPTGPADGELLKSWGSGNWGKNALLRTLEGLNKHGQALWKKLFDDGFDDLLKDLLKKLFDPEDGDSPIVEPHDPNDKVGPIGYGDAGYITDTDALPYRIDYVNAATATASARVVSITDPLDPSIDPRTLQLGQIAFGSTVITVPSGRSFFSTLVDLGASSNLEVQIEAGIDITTDTVFWTLTTIDKFDGPGLRQRRLPAA